jgi:DNA-binding NtrC family response regulator
MDKNAKILVVDDEKDICETLKELLEDEGYAVDTANSAAIALKNNLFLYDAAILDIKIGADDGIILLKQMKEIRPTLPIIMITGHGSVSLAAEAFKFGAYEFIEKPLRLVNVKTVVRNAVEKHKLTAIKAERTVPIVNSQSMRDIYSNCARLASLNMPVMILGDSGSGKELVAQSLHYDGNRADKPFVSVNASALPATLAESELFGHKKGSFTGAEYNRIGAFEKANGGTLFLDEVADLDITVQPKLLRVIETGKFSPVGGDEQTCDVRIVAAKHKDIEKLVEEGKFRTDLWYRLASFVVRIPKLADRPDDIVPIAERFLGQMSREIGEPLKLTKLAKEMLLTFPYKGNVRELRHIISRASLFARNKVVDDAAIKLAISDSLVEKSAQNKENPWLLLGYADAIAAFEQEYFTKLLIRYKGNITQSAASIGMAQGNLSRKLKVMGISKYDKRFK